MTALEWLGFTCLAALGVVVLCVVSIFAIGLAATTLGLSPRVEEWLASIARMQLVVAFVASGVCVGSLILFLGALIFRAIIGG